MIGRLKFDLSALACEILDHLDPVVWTSSTTRFLDPAMGGGQFVSEIERRLLSAGHSRENVAGRVFGCETNVLRVNYARNRVGLIGHYEVCDALSRDWGVMKFDVIVGNPPFNANDTSREDSNHRGQGQNLSRKFFELSLEQGTQFVALVAPYGQRTYSPATKERYMKQGLYKIQNCSSHFPGVSTNACVFFFDRQNESSKRKQKTALFFMKQLYCNRL